MTASTTTTTDAGSTDTRVPQWTSYPLGPARDDDRYDYAEAINLGDWIPAEMDADFDDIPWGEMPDDETVKRLRPNVVRVGIEGAHEMTSTDPILDYAWTVIEHELHVTRSIVEHNAGHLGPGELRNQALELMRDAIRIADELRALPAKERHAEMERTRAMWAAEAVAA